MRKSAPRILAAIGLLAFAPAASTAPITLTLESAGRFARQHNPELKAARGFLAVADARARTTGRWSNPEFDAEIAGGTSAEGRVSVGLTQRFPLTARLRLERKISAFEMESARLEIREKERQLDVAARRAACELAAVRAEMDLREKNAAASRSLADSFKSSADQGAASSLDVAQATLDALEIENAREELRADEARAIGDLATLLGRRADETFLLEGGLELPARLPPNRTPGFRPDLRLAEMAVESGASEVALAKASRWEDVGVGVFVEGERFRDEPEGIEPEALVGLRLSVPLPLWQNGSGRVAEKQASHIEKKDRLAALRLSALNEALTAHRAMSARFRAARQLDAEVLPLARKQIADTEAANRRGEVDFQPLFRSRERLAEFERSAIAARKAFHLAHLQWLASVGAAFNES